MYCGAGTYGKGCPYSPHKTHVHVDDPKRCIYCGATNFGIGCIYNPTGKVHVHGVEFNLLIKECTERGFSFALFLTRLNTPITELPAYKIGLIDESGARIRIPETDEERLVLQPVDVYILKLRRLIGEDRINLLNANVVIEITAQMPKIDIEFIKEHFEQEAQLQDKIQHLVCQYKSIVLEGLQGGFGLADIEKMFINQIVDESHT